jgi:hypothetical protein
MIKPEYNHKTIEESKYAVLFEVYNGELTKVVGYLVCLKYYSCITHELVSYHKRGFFLIEEEGRKEYEQSKNICLY